MILSSLDTMCYLFYINANCKCFLTASRNSSSNNINIYQDNLSVVVYEITDPVMHVILGPS